MSTVLFENKEYSLLRFWGGDERGACLQITPLNQNSIEWLVKKDGSKVKVGDYIHLTRNQVVGCYFRF